jgi:hypothetical protein
MEMWLVVKISPSITVSCCTTVTDLLSRPTRVLPGAVFGEEYGLYLEAGFWGAAVVMMGLMASLLREHRLEDLRRRRLWISLTAAVAIFVTPPLFILAMIETMAPRLMKLPFHHCLYCLWQYLPISILCFVLFVVATYVPVWALFLDLVGRKGEAAVLLPQFLRKLYGIGLLSLAGSLVLLGVHTLLIIGGVL